MAVSMSLSVGDLLVEIMILKEYRSSLTHSIIEGTIGCMRRPRCIGLSANPVVNSKSKIFQFNLKYLFTETLNEKIPVLNHTESYHNINL